jgi:sigma-B regulation protein RsbU (phosphoserine phosphatase)
MENDINQIERQEQIYQLTTLVAGAFSLQEVLDKLAEAAVKITGVKACSIRLLDEDAGNLKMRSTYGLSEEYRNKGPVTRDDPVIKAAFAGEAVILDDMRDDDRVGYKEATIKEGLVSQLTVAMKFRKHAIGVLRLYSPKPKHFDKSDIAIARSVASQCAAAITNARLYTEAIEGARIAEQVRLAGVIQRRMIPDKAPFVEGLDIAATYVPCFDVGGDFYDFQSIGSGRLVITIADVIGKGLPAALMMGLFRGAVRAYTDNECSRSLPAQTSSGGIEQVINKLNKMACRECRDGEFISLFYGIVDTNTKTITYCNCGHEPPLLVRNQETADLDKGGLVLGVDENASYNIDTIDLKKGDSLFFYTDGLIDAANFDGQFWGRDNFVQTAKKCTQDSAEQIVKNIIGYRRRFVGLAKQIDDTSVIVVKFNL